MTAVFNEILNLSIISSFLIVAILILRLILRNAQKGVRYFLWAMVALRLTFPFSFESKLSVLPNAQSFNNTVDTSTTYIPPSVVVTPADAQSTPSFLDILPYIWITGVAIMLLYMAISYLRVRYMVRESVLYKDNIYICDHVKSPFVLGIINPKIYLSSSMSKRDMNLVISHESTHIKHGDNIWKPLAFLLLSVYWFNPLCFISYFLFVKDIELFCDESVTKTLSRTARKKYSYALLGFSKKKTTVSACPLAFAENDVKSRIKNVLSYKKPALYVVVISIILCGVTMVMFMSNPVSTKQPDFDKSITPQKVEETVATTTTETEMATEKSTEPPTQKPTTKPTEKPTQAVQEYSQQDSYNYDSYNYSNTTYPETVPFGQMIEREPFEAPWAQKTQSNTNTSQYSGVQSYSGLQSYDGEVTWD